MPDIKIFRSQWDSDSGGMKGLCVETALGMADCYYHDRFIPLTEIVKNGDGDGTNTTELGAIKAANYLKLNPKPINTFWKDINQQDLKTWLGKGNLIVAFVMYNLIPAKYKQDTFAGLHAILLTAISDDLQSVRYADPDFWGAHREDGWMNNNKWITWAELAVAWKAAYKPFMGLQIDMIKEIPPTEPCLVYKDQITDLSQRLTNTQLEVEGLTKRLADVNTELDDALSKVTALTNTINTLNDELKHSGELLIQSEQENNDLEIRRHELSIKLVEQEVDSANRMTEAERQLSEKDAKLETQREKIAALTSNAEQLTTANIQLQKNTLQAVSDKTIFNEFIRRVFGRIKSILKKGGG